VTVNESSLVVARDQLALWLASERYAYADVKWHEERRALLKTAMADGGIREDSEWWGWITQYLRRAQLLGVESPNGRQAFGKFIVTSMSCAEQAIRVFGPMPRPGVPSGELSDWDVVVPKLVKENDQ
jgi:hypothetical protein